MKHLSILISLFFVLLFFSCNETYTPRPAGYFRIELPEKKYVTYTGDRCPYQFEIPDYAVVSNYSDSVSQPCWKYIKYPVFNAEIFLSYKKINGLVDLDTYLDDAHTLAYKHTVKADAIDETVIVIPSKAYGIVYDISGAAASPVQFFVTDSTRNFIRGALYFNVAPQPDSLAPVIGFLRQDVIRLINTVSWK